VYIAEMSLPSPAAAFRKIAQVAVDVSFGVFLAIVTSPFIQWALMFIGLAAMIGSRHRVLGAVPLLLGLGGAYVARKARI
jgi:hypothetical protein